jgi:hypothetical protein
MNGSPEPKSMILDGKIVQHIPMPFLPSLNVDIFLKNKFYKSSCEYNNVLLVKIEGPVWYII